MKNYFAIAALLVCAPAAFTQDSGREIVKRSARAYIMAGSGSFLGVGVAEIDSDRAKALKLPEERGVEVKSVSDDSPAAKAGIKENDVVLEYQGQAVQGCEQFQRLVRETPVGREVKLTIWRNGSKHTLTATIGRRKGDWSTGNWGFQMPPMPRIDIPHVEMSWRNSALGIEGQSLNPQLADYFGVKDGVLVASVVKNSAAERAGIKAGDVIVKVDDGKVASPREITTILRSIRHKASYTVVLVRNKKEMTVTVTQQESKPEKGTRAVLPTMSC